MKYNTLLLTLLSIASTLEYKLENKLLARDTYFADAVIQCGSDNDNCEDLFINYDDALECKKNFDTYYNKCKYVDVKFENKDEIDYLCNKFMSSQCEDFFNISIKNLPGCKDISPVFLENYIKIKEDTKLAFTLKCSKDDDNEYCPLSKFNFYENSQERGFKAINIDVDDIEFVKALHHSCDSDKCFDTATEALSRYKENRKDFKKKLHKGDDHEEFRVLESDFCHQHIEDIMEDITQMRNSEQTVQNKNSTNNINNESLLLGNGSTTRLINNYSLFIGLITIFILQYF